jgi:hypothetical protein
MHEADPPELEAHDGVVTRLEVVHLHVLDPLVVVQHEVVRRHDVVAEVRCRDRHGAAGLRSGFGHAR